MCVGGGGGGGIPHVKVKLPTYSGSVCAGIKCGEWVHHSANPLINMNLNTVMLVRVGLISPL